MVMTRISLLLSLSHATLSFLAFFTLTFSTFSFPCSSLALTVRADPIHIPITRRRRTSEFSADSRGVDYYARIADRTRYKYGFSTTADDDSGVFERKRNVVENTFEMNSTKFGKRSSSAGNVGLSITDQNQDDDYFGTISIGTPASNFNVLLDSGSADLWLAGPNCEVCESSGIAIFDPSKSSSFQNSSSSVTIQYGSGKIAGQKGKDNVSMGGFTIQSQTFLSVTNMSQNLVTSPVSGIMGLAFQSISHTSSTPFWQALVNAGDLVEPEMGFWLARAANEISTDSDNTFSAQTSDVPGGIFTLGGTNTSLFSGDIDFLEIEGSPSYWLLTLKSLTVQSKSVSLSSSSAAAIDTGTRLIGGPTSDVKAFWNSVEGSATAGNNTGLYSFPCNTTINTTLSFGGQTWTISSQDMNLGPVKTGSDNCIGGIFDLNQGSEIPSGSGNPDWIIGDVFLKNVYTVFRGASSKSDNSYVGFAQLSTTAGGSGTAAGNAGDANTISSSNGTSQRGSPFSLLLIGVLLTVAFSRWGFA